MPEEKQRPIILTDFSGGLNQNVSLLDLKPNECLEAYNVKFYRPDGCISPRPGRKWMTGMRGNAMASSMSTDIIGIHQFHTSAGTTYPMIAVCCASNIPAQLGYLSGNSTAGALFHNLLDSESLMHYGWVGGAKSAPICALSGKMFSADTIHFADYDHQLIMTWAPSGVDARNVTDLAPPLLWDGITASATALMISSEPHLGPEDDRSAGSADRVICTMVGLSAARVGTFKGHLFLMNTVEMEMMSSDGSATGYFSAAWHPYRTRWNVPGASSIKCVVESAGGVAWDYNDFMDFDPGDGYGLTGYANLGEEILIFKKDKTFSISWVGGDEKFNYRKVSDRIGCIAPKSVVTGKGMAAWAADDGFYVYDGTKPTRISDKIKKIYSSINVDRRMLVAGTGWDELKQVWWSIPYGTSDRNSYGVIADFTAGDPAKVTWATATLSLGNLIPYNKQVQEDSAVGIWGTDYTGWAHRYDENINYETSGDHTDATGIGTKMSGGIAYSWKSIWSEFDAPENIKRIKRIRTTFDRNTTAGHVTLNVRKNWETGGLADATSQRPLSGRSAGLSGDLIYDKANFTAKGQVMQLQYITSAGAMTNSPPPCMHNFTIHEIGLDIDVQGSLFYGAY